MLAVQRISARDGQAQRRRAKHLKNGCPAGNRGGELEHLRWTIIDFMETTTDRLSVAGHLAGPRCMQMCGVPETERN